MATKKTVSKKAASSAGRETKESTPTMISAKPTVKKTTVAKKKSVVTKPNPQTRKTSASPVVETVTITPDQRHKLICETAYYLSLQRSGFDEHSAIDDWLQAEKTIDQKYRVTG